MPPAKYKFPHNKIALVALLNRAPLPKRRASKHNAYWGNRFVQNPHGEPIGDKTVSCQICNLARGEVSEMPPRQIYRNPNIKNDCATIAQCLDTIECSLSQKQVWCVWKAYHPCHGTLFTLYIMQHRHLHQNIHAYSDCSLSPFQEPDGRWGTS